jgi:hypothetical protein
MTAAPPADAAGKATDAVPPAANMPLLLPPAMLMTMLSYMLLPWWEEARVV